MRPSVRGDAGGGDPRDRRPGDERAGRAGVARRAVGGVGGRAGRPAGGRRGRGGRGPGDQLGRVGGAARRRTPVRHPIQDRLRPDRGNTAGAVGRRESASRSIARGRTRRPARHAAPGRPAPPAHPRDDEDLPAPRAGRTWGPSTASNSGCSRPTTRSPSSRPSPGRRNWPTGGRGARRRRATRTRTGSRSGTRCTTTRRSCSSTATASATWRACGRRSSARCASGVRTWCWRASRTRTVGRRSGWRTARAYPSRSSVMDRTCLSPGDAGAGAGWSPKRSGRRRWSSRSAATSPTTSSASGPLATASGSFRTGSTRICSARWSGPGAARGWACRGRGGWCCSWATS